MSAYFYFIIKVMLHHQQQGLVEDLVYSNEPDSNAVGGSFSSW